MSLIHPGPCLARPFHPAYSPHPHSERFVAERAYLWAPGKTIRVLFGTPDSRHPEWGGTTAQRAAAMAGARVWEKYANIHFAEVTDPRSADVRCSFQPGGSWCEIGTDARSDPNNATMNLGWDDDPGMIIHEFGHALGLEHEQGNPAVLIPWNVPYLHYTYGQPPNNWTPAEVDEQVVQRYNPQGLVFTKWDKLSIMQYPITPPMVTDPSYVVGWNEAPSPTDIANIGRLYPR
jgi:serralysin